MGPNKSRGTSYKINNSLIMYSRRVSVVGLSFEMNIRLLWVRHTNLGLTDPHQANGLPRKTNQQAYLKITPVSLIMSAGYSTKYPHFEKFSETQTNDCTIKGANERNTRSLQTAERLPAAFHNMSKLLDMPRQ